MKASWNPMMRGTALGAFFGILPGAGPTIASFSAYTLEKKVSKNSANFGKGAIEGVASPEAANNSASQCEFIPTPLIGLSVKLLTVPYRLLFPAIMVFMAIGVYSVNNNPFDVHLALLFGVLGCVFIKLKCEPAPLILAVVLGPLMEENLRHALLISRGDASVFVTRPISAGFLIATVLLLLVMSLPAMRRKREDVLEEVGGEGAIART
ncbi:MAG TPA: tripartite tricarboxylate transporter permease [Burkholderiales bacterium]|nr:tripartite tricarboxylate transporter permease [Burkholderiales bacterium]